MAIAFGWLSRAYFVVPGTNLVVVSIGSSWGWARSCRQYDDGYTQTLIWNAIRPAVAPLWNSSTTATAAPAAAARACRRTPSAPSRRAPGGWATARRPRRATTAPVRSPASAGARARRPKASGTCFNLEAGSAAAENGYCAGVVDRAAETCPRIAIVAQCNATMRNWTAAQICAVAVGDTLSSETGWLGLTKTNCVPMPAPPTRRRAGRRGARATPPSTAPSATARPPSLRGAAHGDGERASTIRTLGPPRKSESVCAVWSVLVTRACVARACAELYFSWFNHIAHQNRNTVHHSRSGRSGAPPRPRLGSAVHEAAGHRRRQRVHRLARLHRQQARRERAGVRRRRGAGIAAADGGVVGPRRRGGERRRRTPARSRRACWAPEWSDS